MSSNNVDLLILYHALLLQLQSRYQMDSHLTIEDLPDVVQHLPAHRMLRKKFSQPELDLVDRFIMQDIDILIHNRIDNQLNHSPTYLMFKNMLLDALYESADQCQLKFYEMKHDIACNGVYLVGEVLSQGALECSHCGLLRHYQHLETVDSCERCHCDVFERPVYYPIKNKLNA